MNPTRQSSALKSHVIRWAVGVALPLLCVVAPAIAGDGTMTCGTPTSGGTISLRIKVGRNTVCQDPLTIVIPAPPTPPPPGLDTLKAEQIRKTIAAKCTELTVTRAIGSNQVVISSPDGKVTIEELSNTTGEADTYAMSFGWGSTLGQLCTLTGPVGGLSCDGIHPGRVMVGTSTWVANVPTTPGQSASAVLGAALAQLNAHGVANVSLVSLGPNQAGLLFHLSNVDAFLAWGCDDRGTLNQFLALEDSTEVGSGSTTGEFFVPPGTPGVTLQLDPSPTHTHSEATLYGYDPAQQAWTEQSYWSVGDTPVQLHVATSPQIVHYQLRCVGDHAPVTGTIIDGAAAPQTPSTPLLVPGFSLGWSDGSGAEFNPTLGQGGGSLPPIVIQPGLSLNSVPAQVGANHADYIPLQFNLQPDPSRPWLYLGNDPGQGFAEHTTLSLHLAGLFDPFGNPIQQLPIVVGVTQGATQWSMSVNAIADGNGGITVPSLDLGSLLAQPFTLYVGVGAVPGPQAAATAALFSGAPGFVTVDGIELSSAPSTTAGVDPGHSGRMTAVSFAAPYPNPCRADARLHFATPRAGAVRLQILDASGRIVRTIANRPMEAGAHDLRWDARDDSDRRVAEGIYFARLEADGAHECRKVTVLR